MTNPQHISAASCDFSNHSFTAVEQVVLSNIYFDCGVHSATGSHRHTDGPFSGPFTTDLDIGCVTNSGRQSERKQKKGKSWHMS